MAFASNTVALSMAFAKGNTLSGGLLIFQSVWLFFALMYHWAFWSNVERTYGYTGMQSMQQPGFPGAMAVPRPIAAPMMTMNQAFGHPMPSGQGLPALPPLPVDNQTAAATAAAMLRQRQQQQRQ